MSTRTVLHPLFTQLKTALADGGPGLAALAAADPVDWRDLLLTLSAIHDLHAAPLRHLNGAERLQHHPAVAAIKWRLEEALVAEFDRRDEAAGWDLPERPSAAMRAIAVRGLVPEVYEWLADDATPREIIEFLSIEGGPDGGFDDLVAACQIGLDGTAKLELARNYWDEMGNGSLARVHTELHRKLTRTLGLACPPREQQPVEALERSVVSGLLTTNRWLQPEMLGALGLLELQAGPRCRKVVTALQRIGAGEDALDFYVEHANVDPRHGKDWVDKAVVPFDDDPRWAPGIIRGARWRSIVNAGFFGAMADSFVQQQRRAS
ncbi:MAG TPA: iron-containing redox enzyme family protein [Acidimicrobiales bacterium]|nr:iron-containing redox enzyme family protein [Acidimicrobiales bacterium]